MYRYSDNSYDCKDRDENFVRQFIYKRSVLFCFVIFPEFWGVSVRKKIQRAFITNVWGGRRFFFVHL